MIIFLLAVCGVIGFNSPNQRNQNRIRKPPQVTNFQALNDQKQNKINTDSIKFTQDKELTNGRLAMVGMAAGLIREQLTGLSFLEQIGLQNQQQQDSFVIIIGSFCLLAVVGKISSLKETALWY